MTPTTLHPRLSRDTSSTLVIHCQLLLSSDPPLLYFSYRFSTLILLTREKLRPFLSLRVKTTPNFVHCDLRLVLRMRYVSRRLVHSACCRNRSCVNLRCTAAVFSVKSVCRTLHSRLSTVNGSTRGSMDSRTSFRTTYFSFGSASSATATGDKLNCKQSLCSCPTLRTIFTFQSSRRLPLSVLSCMQTGNFSSHFIYCNGFCRHFN